MTQRLSPLHHIHLANKATMTEYAGWLLPEKYTAPQSEAENALRSVGVCDISSLEKLDIKGANIDFFLKGILGASGPVGSVSLSREKTSRIDYVCRLAKDHALAICRENSGNSQTRSPLELSGFPSVERCYLTNVTSVFAGVTLLGPSAPDLLGQLTQIDISARSRDGWCGEGGLARVRAVVVRSELPWKSQTIPSFEIFFGRDYAEFLWDTIMEMGSKYSITPLGEAARRLIQGSRGMTK